MNESSQIGRTGYRILIGGWSMASQSSSPLVFGLGVVGLIYDARANPSYAACAGIHAAFGVVLSAAVFTRFNSRMKLLMPLAAHSIAVLSRNLSRQVYLLMYLLLGLQIALGIDRTQPPPVESFRDYLVCGILAIIIIRVLSARSARRAAFTPGSRVSAKDL